MYGSWHEVPEPLRVTIAALALFIAVGWIAYSPLHSEIKRNEELAAPDDQQIRWDIRHIREDLAMAVKLLILIALMLFFFLVRPI